MSTSAFLLTTASVMMCPHGGMVACAPVTSTSYRVAGQRPLLMTDVFVVAGCTFNVGGAAMPCNMIQWANPSVFLRIKGIPALTSSSVGLTIGVGAPMPVIIALASIVNEPSEITDINY